MTSKPSAIYLGMKGTEHSLSTERIIAEAFEVLFAEHFSFGDIVDQDKLANLQADFLFSFGPIILGEQLLKSVKIAAINFHTAPPKWPGRGSCSMALLDGDTEFGATAHLMEAVVDSGAILRVLRFPIEDNDDAESLRERTLRIIPNLASELINDLEQNSWRPSPSGESWLRKAIRQKDVIKMMRIDETDSEETLQRKIKAFAHSQKPGPFIERAGHRFWYMKKLS